ncbi:MAG: hypothetical protein N4A44_01805 [Alphaproteobacteria bacterium]|jgi:cell division transport system permease protein|nr:hypothetical protein [Alphaproteobacteria bacterium]
MYKKISSLNKFKDNFFAGEIDNNFISFISAFIVFLMILFSSLIFSINSIFGNWQDNLSRNFTIQVLPYYKTVSGENKISSKDVEKRTSSLIDQLDKLKGIKSVKIQKSEDSVKNLKKLLGGNSVNIDKVPLPIIVNIETSEFIDISTKDIERATKKIDGVKIFDNRSWVKEFVDFASIIKNISYFIIATLLLTSIVVVFYFTKSFLKTQRKVVKIAHIVGAHDNFIANAFSNRILFLSATGAIFGTIVSILLLIVLKYMFAGIQTITTMEVSISMFGWLCILSIPFVVSFLFQRVANRTILRYLVRQD